MRSARPDDIAREIGERSAGQHLVVLCDFDGTLCEFHPDPGAVWMPSSIGEALDAIATRTDATVGLVTGRRIDDVRRRAGLSASVYYAGLHGLEIEVEGERFRHPDIGTERDLIHRLADAMSAELSSLGGVFLEDKDVSIVAHFREASPEVQAYVPEIFERHARPYIKSGRLRIMKGSCARELLPKIDWHKGSAVIWICDRVAQHHGSAWPVYIGDDLTDEDAFRALKRTGLGIAASDRVSGAAYRIEGPSEVEALLNRLR